MLEVQLNLNWDFEVERLNIVNDLQNQKKVNFASF
jgi:hypothetical protein